MAYIKPRSNLIFDDNKKWPAYAGHFGARPSIIQFVHPMGTSANLAVERVEEGARHAAALLEFLRGKVGAGLLATLLKGVARGSVHAMALPNELDDRASMHDLNPVRRGVFSIPGILPGDHGEILRDHLQVKRFFFRRLGVLPPLANHAMPAPMNINTN